MSQTLDARDAPSRPVRERVFSGIQPSGASHLGNYLGAQVNYVALQDQYDAIYGIVDLHALTTVHDGAELRRLTHEMVLDLLAVGLDPERCALIRQSDLPEHSELAWIFETCVPVAWAERNPTYKEAREDGKENSLGLLNYPVLQAADIVIYKASRVPVGKDQAAHLELSREIVRAFNRRYGAIFPEPQPVFTDAPVVIGIDGVRKMGKSAGNTIPIFAEPDEIRRLVMSMVTDPLRIKRTDPGRPEVCNVCQLHRFFGSDYLQIQDGERTARTGCVDTKQLLAERIIEFFRPMREERARLAADPAIVEETLAAGAAKVRPILDATMAEVRQAVGIGPGRVMAGVTWQGSGIGPRERWWLVVFLALGSTYFAFLVTERVLDLLGGLGTILLILFLAWLLAFVMSSLVGALEQRINLPRPAIVIGSYLLALIIFGFVVFYTGAAITQQVDRDGAQLSRHGAEHPRRAGRMGARAPVRPPADRPHRSLRRRGHRARADRQPDR